jgi:hypothetical protein
VYSGSNPKIDRSEYVGADISKLLAHSLKQKEFPQPVDVWFSACTPE